MNVTRDVIIDLWPLYASGEASADTRALIDQFLAQDPEFARMVREGGLKMLEPAAPSLPADHEKATLTRTKQLLRYRDIALVATVLLFTVSSLVRLYRPWTILLSGVALGSFFWLWMLGRRLRVKGL